MAPEKLVPSKHQRPALGDLLAQCLRALGIDTAFGKHGGHLDVFAMDCNDSGVRLIHSHDEGADIDATKGYIRSEGKLGVSITTTCNG